MSRFKTGIVTLGATMGILAVTFAGAWERGPADAMPGITQNVQSGVESLTVGPDGNYVRGAHHSSLTFTLASLGSTPGESLSTMEETPTIPFAPAVVVHRGAFMEA